MRTSVKWTLGCGGASLLFFGLLALLFGILYFSYSPDSGQQVLCSLGSQSSCQQLQNAAAGHALVALALGVSVILCVFSGLAAGITAIALLVR